MARPFDSEEGGGGLQILSGEGFAQVGGGGKK